MRRRDANAHRINNIFTYSCNFYDLISSRIKLPPHNIIISGNLPCSTFIEFIFFNRNKFGSAKKRKSASRPKMNSCAIRCEDHTNFKPSKIRDRRTVAKKALREDHTEASSTTRIRTTSLRSAQSTITTKQSVSINLPLLYPYFQPTPIFDSSTLRP